MPKQGEFVWHDLATTDVDAATAFYSEIMAWKGAQLPGVEMTYIGFENADGVTVGGAMTLMPEMAAMGAPPSWTPCIASEDIDAVCAKAVELGGRVLNPPTDVPGGRFALVQDPQGAVFETYQAEDKNGEAEQHANPPAGHFCWYDLNTTDWEGARSFYEALFGWSESGTMDDSPAGTYWMFKSTSGDRTVGGMSNMAATMGMPAHWLCYVTVADLDAALARLQELGGKLLNGPMDIPGGDRIAHCMDPQGAAIALHASA